MTYAGFGKRFLAYFIDMVILNFIGWLFSLIIGVYSYLVLIIIQWIYFSLMESSEKQATLGKLLFEIIVTDIDGERLTFGRATARFFSKFLSYLSFFVGFFLATQTERSQALHDIIAGTLVIEKQTSLSYDTKQFTEPIKIYPNFETESGKPAVYGLNGENSGRVITVGEEGVIFGRDSSYCQVIFSHDAPGISRRHCKLSYDNDSGTFILVDIGSSYGTYLESGKKLKQGKAVKLRVGEKFYLTDPNNMFEVRVQ